VSFWSVIAVRICNALRIILIWTLKGAAALLERFGEYDA
jgi:hypothetical protein